MCCKKITKETKFFKDTTLLEYKRPKEPRGHSGTISNATPSRLLRLGVLKRTIDREDGVASGKLECPPRGCAVRLMAFSSSVLDHPRVSTGWPFTPSGLVAHIIYQRRKTEEEKVKKDEDERG